MNASLGSLLGLVQVLLGVRVAWRLLRSGGDSTIRAVADGTVHAGVVSVILPVLNEAQRLSPCLEALQAQGAEVNEILVVDSGSMDGTRDLVQRYVRRDRRIRLIQAGTAPDDWNGKVWGLHHGARALASNAEWILTLDADVVATPGLAAALVSRARERRLRLLSVATRQHVSGVVQGVLHPSMLASLVY
ncbi:MAG: glycosyltransferase family 2 protein, partial [Chloroflexi bacterium]|nr:glycosyltransferase family 2 protein [Chloroflexota bacterium]